ncbi:MAG: hypothetical protein DMG13_00530 [Acidobacteria bacterium]|nr:MAG: hypothetical protein DMG13_00530 [Acidobacteriota bacterium]
MQKEARSQKPEARRTRCKLSVAILASGLWLLASFCLHAEIIDRIVAIVEGRIITTSDIRREREVRGILGEKPVDDKPLINELIENDLIENQMADFPGVEVSDSEIETALKKVQPPNDARIARAVREALGKRIQMAKYFDIRFRQFLRASDEEIRKYYDDVFVPEAKKRGLDPIPPVDQVADVIRKNIVEEKLDHEVNIWMEAVRRRSDIEIFE